MRADAYSHQNFRFDGSMLVLGVCGREFGRIAFGQGIGQLTVKLGQFCQLLRRALDDPDRFAAPLHSDFFSGL